MVGLIQRILSSLRHKTSAKRDVKKNVSTTRSETQAKIKAPQQGGVQPKAGVYPKSVVDIRDGLLAALQGKDDIAAFPNKFLYQFEDVRHYNLEYPIIPAAVTYPKTPEQISAIVKYAASVNLKVQARSGGHSYGNYGIGGQDGAIVIDMKNFQQFSMDPSTWNAVIGAGTLLDDVTKKLYEAGKRAMAHGICPQVGAGGHLTIGGFGPMSRMWGPALDHILEAQVVLADGSIVRASNTENEDVFFAIRGAASGFGIVTEFKVKTHPTPEKLVRYSYTLELGSFPSMAQSFKNWQDFISNPDLSRKLYTQVTICPVGMIISGTFFGTEQEFDSLHLDSVFHKTPKSRIVELDDWLGTVVHWTEDLGLHLIGGISSAFYCKALALKKEDLLSPACIEQLFDNLENVDKGTILWFINFEMQGGATNDVPADQTAYAHRDILVYLESFGIDIGRVTPTTRKFLEGINDTITSSMPGREFGSYPGYVDPNLPNGQKAYWGSNLPRLEQIKKKLDPQDIFHNPQSVRPASS